MATGAAGQEAASSLEPPGAAGIVPSQHVYRPRRWFLRGMDHRPGRPTVVGSGDRRDIDGVARAPTKLRPEKGGEMSFGTDGGSTVSWRHTGQSSPSRCAIRKWTREAAD